VIVSAYAAACSGRTRLVVVDRITSPTATVVPVAAVAAAATGVGTAVPVDAAHAPGQLGDDIPAFGAILWSRPGARVRPTVLSWQLEDGYAASFDYPGTWDYAGCLAAADGLAYWEALGGWDAVARLAHLAADGQKRVSAAHDPPEGPRPSLRDDPPRRDPHRFGSPASRSLGGVVRGTRP